MCCLVHYGHGHRGEDVCSYMPQIQRYGLQVWPVLASPSAFREQYDSADIVLDSIEAARIGPLDERERIRHCLELGRTFLLGAEICHLKPRDGDPTRRVEHNVTDQTT